MAAMSRPAQPAMTRVSMSAWRGDWSGRVKVSFMSFCSYRVIQERLAGEAASQRGRSVHHQCFLTNTTNRKLARNSSAATKYRPEESDPVLVFNAPIM